MIGLALSGGGFRAAAFHVGVLKRLEEVGILPHVHIVSTVSGGSMTGALYALRCAQRGNGGRPGSYPVEQLMEEVRTLVTDNFRRRALFGSPTRVARTALSFVSWRFSRMTLLVEELDRQLFGGAHLPALPPWMLINATNLATGKSWKFFRDRAGDYLIGATDQTNHIRVAEAVGASAAYPLLTDPYPFKTHWDELRADHLDGRWERPPVSRPGDISAWRRRFGKPSGAVTLPLADGGLYDNEGLNGLRSARVEHAIYASTAPPDEHFEGLRGAGSVLRMVGVIHNRLGAVTRQHAHEMTHGCDPGRVRQRLLEMADELREMASEPRPANADPRDGSAQTISERLMGLSREVDDLSAVGFPPRGPQYQSITPILLHRTDVARNRFATFRPPYDIPLEYRGLDAALVDQLARIRTDLDAYPPVVVDLLIAQAYFLTDAYLKVSMPDVLSAVSGVENVQQDLPPFWDWAKRTIERANANRDATRELLHRASRRRLIIGHAPTTP